jgi:hypothetical protein
MKEIHFSQHTTNIGPRRFVSNHRQRVCHRMLDSVCRSDVQGDLCYTSVEHPIFHIHVNMYNYARNVIEPSSFCPSPEWAPLAAERLADRLCGLGKNGRILEGRGDKGSGVSRRPYTRRHTHKPKHCQNIRAEIVIARYSWICAHFFRVAEIHDRGGGASIPHESRIIQQIQDMAAPRTFFSC